MEGWFRGDEREIVVMEQNEFENGGRPGWCRGLGFGLMFIFLTKSIV